MIPIRVYLKDFLCYTEQEFCFDGHPVWLLHGPNGAGKSAVFDGMVYALFGVSQRYAGSKNTAVDLIRHGVSSMRVEFDFKYGGRRYRIWRTRSRSKTPKQGINEWTDDGPVPVRDVNGVKDVDNWITSTLGLTYDSFVSAVLLRQGSAEKLIDADKDVRRELFRGIINLEAYLRLHQTVVTARTEVGGGVRSLRASLERMPIVLDEELTVAKNAWNDAISNQKQARELDNCARERLGHARLWEQLEQSRRQLLQQLEDAAGRYSRAAELECAVHRLSHLRTVLPTLNLVVIRRQELRDTEQELGTLTSQRERVIEQHEAASAAQQQERQKATEHRKTVTDLDRQIASLTSMCENLRREIQQAEQAADLHQKLTDARDRSKQFEPTLDEDFVEIEARVVASQNAKDAVPHLEALSRHRSNYRQAVLENQSAVRAEAASLIEIEQLRQREADAGQIAEQTTRRLSEVNRLLAMSEERLAQARLRQEKFVSLTGAPICSECGQTIDSQHAARELEKFERLIREAESDHHGYGQQSETARNAANEASALQQQRETERRRAELARDNAVRARALATRRMSEARTGFDRARAELANEYSHRVGTIDAGEYPLPVDITDLQRLKNELPQRKKERDRLRDRRQERDTTGREIETLTNAVQALGAPADVTIAKRELPRQEQTLSGLYVERQRTDECRIAAENAETEFSRTVLNFAQENTHLSTAVGRAENTVATARQRLAEAVQLIPVEYVTSMDTGRFDLNLLLNELNELQGSGVEDELKALENDRVLKADRERQLGDTERRIAELPEEGRRPVQEVELGVKAAEQGLQDAAERLRHTAERFETLTRQRTGREDAQKQMGIEERNHTLHERLATLLGESGIQLDLMRNAERRIIELANEILIRVSCGELRFEPPDLTSDRAFDLSVRRMACPGVIAVSNLSGGQRFRVAVSLSLAICRFANGEHRPLESVIIDEGFGCLDREGRMAMIAELRDGQTLSRMFKRVIVVSHQEDFASAFPVGYRLRTEDGLTRVDPFGPGSAA